MLLVYFVFSSAEGLVFVILILEVFNWLGRAPLSFWIDS